MRNVSIKQRQNQQPFPLDLQLNSDIKLFKHRGQTFYGSLQREAWGSEFRVVIL